MGMKMRNGMSVKEVYAKLDRLEELEKDYAGLAQDYMNLVEVYEDLINSIGKAAFYFDHVAGMYKNVSESEGATAEDKLEFYGRIKGLKEAKTYILDILKNHLGEEKKDDVQGETEGEEPTV